MNHLIQECKKWNLKGKREIAIVWTYCIYAKRLIFRTKTSNRNKTCQCNKLMTTFLNQKVAVII